MNTRSQQPQRRKMDPEARVNGVFETEIWSRKLKTNQRVRPQYDLHPGRLFRVVTLRLKSKISRVLTCQWN